MLKTIRDSTIITATLLLFAPYANAAEQGDQFETPAGRASNALQVLEAALTDTAGTQSSVEVLTAAAKDALEFLPEQSPVAELLISAIARPKEEGKEEDLVRAIKKICSMLAFQPQKEADLPKGFPTFTPVGLVEIKEYPAYRKAVAGQFWTLFRHIQSNKISMTTPVEMKYGQSSTGEFSQQSMAFLYGNTELGKLGKNGNVDVVDVKPLTVIAIGVRGRRSQAAVNHAHLYLTRWIEAHAEFAASGPPRVLGYNSPMVRQADTFFEIQVPIRKLDAKVSQ